MEVTRASVPFLHTFLCPQRSLGEFEQLDQITDAAAKIKSVNERATLFRITSNAMINVSIQMFCKHIFTNRLDWVFNSMH